MVLRWLPPVASAVVGRHALGTVLTCGKGNGRAMDGRAGREAISRALTGSGPHDAVLAERAAQGSLLATARAAPRHRLVRFPKRDGQPLPKNLKEASDDVFTLKHSAGLAGGLRPDVEK